MFVKTPTNLSRNFKIFALASAGIGFRIAASKVGHNYDFESYKLVVESSKNGLSPWQTGRYNYGPLWAQMLYLFDWVSSNLRIDFRLQIVLFLSLADFVIALFIAKKKGWQFGWAFFLNPVSILISGYHNQFDNVAIALVCLAVMKTEEHSSRKFGFDDFVPLVLLGLSLGTKHIFLVFVFWIAVKQRGFTKKIYYALLPLVIFFGLFVPYFDSSRDAIWKTVVAYRSFDNAPIWSLIGVENGIGGFSVMMIFVTILTTVGLVTRAQDLRSSLFLYTILIVALAPAIANQYLAISLVGIFGLFNTTFLLYIIYSTYWLVMNVDGFALRTRLNDGFLQVVANQRILDFMDQTGYQPMTVLLIIGVSLELYRGQLVAKKI